MVTQALINPAILTWARERAGLSAFAFTQKMGLSKPEKLELWESGVEKPTFKQAQKIAAITHIPFGYLFLSVPPKDTLPIPDLRTIGNKHIEEPSLEMKDVIKQVLIKQEWFKDYLISQNEEPLSFIGSYSIQDSVEDVANDIRETIKVPIPTKGDWESYMRDIIRGAETARILVMRAGIVGNNTHRKLQVSEFRGFAISDKLAPVIFINSSDAPTARLFTLVHELAHLWIGESGISNVESHGSKQEVFCNAVAGEFLVPKATFFALWDEENSLMTNLANISYRLHVSKLVVARKAYDLGVISKDDYWNFYNNELEAFREKDGGSGNFNINAAAKNSRLFSHAVLSEALSGRMLLRDAGSLLGIKPNKLKNYASAILL
ncbi:helix-turn-helix domain-containing protein [Shewanella sp.]|uniref:helix-turn-helix domain-containing protein n=1 Tax=Shewanella sp. TaxID=50422 RepID=UPI003A8893C0